MELLSHPSEWNFRLPARLNPQLIEWAEWHFSISRKYARLDKIFPHKFSWDERQLANFLDYFYGLSELLPNFRAETGEEEKTRKIINALSWFSGHDIEHLKAYKARWKVSIFLKNPEVYFPNFTDAIRNFRDCTEGVGIFLSPDTPSLETFDIGEVLARNMRKTQLRNQNYIYDPTSSGTIERHLENQAKKLAARQCTLSKGIKDKSQSDVFREDMFHKSGTADSIFDCVEFDFHEVNWPLLIEQWNRGRVFLILYNIIKNGYKMIEKFADYSWTIEAVQRDIKAGWKANFDIEELRKMNYENRLFRQEIDRRGGKLKISAEVVDAGDAFVIHIWDNATGFDLNGIKRWIKEMAESKYADFLELCVDPILPPELRDGLKKWQKNPHMSGIISSHMPEFIKLARFSQHGSSGLWLFGSEVLARKLGGSVLAAEMINGWAFFSVVVPKDARKWIDKPNKQTKKFQQEVASRVLPVIDGRMAA